MAETWLNECSNILWKFELGNNKIGYLSEQIAQESFKGACFLLTPYTKMQEDRNELKKVLSTEKSGLKDVENSQVS